MTLIVNCTGKQLFSLPPTFEPLAASYRLSSRTALHRVPFILSSILIGFLCFSDLLLSRVVGVGGRQRPGRFTNITQLKDWTVERDIFKAYGLFL